MSQAINLSYMYMHAIHVCVVWNTFVAVHGPSNSFVDEHVLYYDYTSYMYNTGEDSQSFGGATTTVAIISTLLVVVIITAGICFTVQIIYKLTTRKKRYCFSQVMHSSILSTTYTFNII